MTRIAAVESRSRPAAAALEQRFAPDLAAFAADTAALDALALEHARINAAIAALVARTDRGEARGGELNRLTDEIARLLGRSEELRVARARAAALHAGDGAGWTHYLDLD